MSDERTGDSQTAGECPMKVALAKAVELSGDDVPRTSAEFLNALREDRIRASGDFELDHREPSRPQMHHDGVYRVPMAYKRDSLAPEFWDEIESVDLDQTGWSGIPHRHWVDWNRSQAYRVLPDGEGQRVRRVTVPLRQVEREFDPDFVPPWRSAPVAVVASAADNPILRLARDLHRLDEACRSGAIERFRPLAGVVLQELARLGIEVDFSDGSSIVVDLRTARRVWGGLRRLVLESDFDGLMQVQVEAHASFSRSVDRGKSPQTIEPKREDPDGARYKTGFVGRPSSKDLIVEEFERRASASQTESTLKEEASTLLEWLVVTHPSAPRPGRGAIENTIREAFRQNKRSK